MRDLDGMSADGGDRSQHRVYRLRLHHGGESQFILSAWSLLKNRLIRRSRWRCTESSAIQNGHSSGPQGDTSAFPKGLEAGSSGANGVSNKEVGREGTFERDWRDYNQLKSGAEVSTASDFISVSPSPCTIGGRGVHGSGGAWVSASAPYLF